MAATVVNVRVKNIRPKYANLKEWRSDPENVYIGRGRVVLIDGERYPRYDSIFANPFKGEDAIEKYRKYLVKSFLHDHIRLEDLDELKGKNLGCWCKPEKCHGDVVIEFLEMLIETEENSNMISPDGYLLDDDGYVVVKFVRT